MVHLSVELGLGLVHTESGGVWSTDSSSVRDLAGWDSVEFRSYRCSHWYLEAKDVVAHGLTQNLQP